MSQQFSSSFLFASFTVFSLNALLANFCFRHSWFTIVTHALILQHFSSSPPSLPLLLCMTHFSYSFELIERAEQFCCQLQVSHNEDGKKQRIIYLVVRGKPRKGDRKSKRQIILTLEYSISQYLSPQIYAPINATVGQIAAIIKKQDIS